MYTFHPRLVFVAALMALPVWAQVAARDILASPNENWLTYAGDYQGKRHSPLKQITPRNAGSLVPKWTNHISGATHLEASPIVHDGVWQRRVTP